METLRYFALETEFDKSTGLIVQFTGGGVAQNFHTGESALDVAHKLIMMGTQLQRDIANREIK